MKKPFIIGTVAALTIANTEVTGIASTLDNPRQEAEHVIVDQVPADEQEIQERGPALMSFWRPFASSAQPMSRHSDKGWLMLSRVIDGRQEGVIWWKLPTNAAGSGVSN